MKRKLFRWFYKFQTLSPFFQPAYGKFRVLDPNGKRSYPMDYKTAKNHVAIFGGKVIYNF